MTLNVNSILNSSSTGLNSKTGFGELLTAAPTPLVQLQFPYSNSTQLINTAYASSIGTVNVLSSGILSITNGTVVSNDTINMFAGQGVCVIFSCEFLSGAQTGTSFVGVANSNVKTGSPTYTIGSTMSSGIGVGYSGGVFGVWVPVPNGPPSFTSITVPADLTPTSVSTYKIQYTQAGYATISYARQSTSVGLSYGEFAILWPLTVNDQNPMSPLTNPSMQLICQGNNGTIYLYSIGAYIEGIVNTSQDTRNTINETVSLSSSTLTRLIAIQSNQAYNSATNQVRVYPDLLSIGATGATMTFTLYLNPTITGATYANSIGANSVVNYDTAGTTVSLGSNTRLLFQTTLLSGQQQIIDLTPYKIWINPTNTLAPNQLAVAVQQSVGTTNTATGSLGWRERF